MRELRYVVCDVFTDRPLTGNQLAVFTNAAGVDDLLMQALAREMNFSETTFVVRATGDAHFKVRIFTPAREVPFAGHPVLGTAFVIGASMQSDDVRLETGRGVISVKLEREGNKPVFGWMTQPVPSVEPFVRGAELLGALAVDKAESPIETYDNGIRHTMVELASRELVASLKPDFAQLLALPTHGVSAFSGSGLEWKTRMFAPEAGVNEDPATGSAAGPLAVHLARHGRIAFGDEIRIEQGAELGRPSVLYARITGTRERIERVEVGGSAVPVARGAFHLP